MTEQRIFNFNNTKNFFEENLIRDASNSNVLNFLDKFPNWETKLINIVGEKKSGKSFILQLFRKKNQFNYISNKEDFEKKYDELFLVDKLILDGFQINEDKFFSLINHFILHKKYLIISSREPLTMLEIKLLDLKSRLKEFLLIEIQNPSDDLIYSLILKYFSDNQIVIKKDLVEYIVKKIDRSYSSIEKFLIKLNDQSIIKKKKIDYKLINEVLNETA
ncbi:MAG: DnaA/Hda family protein [Pelagibacteraceae bacterium]|nr:DnaA/Hda family protein [Pelagibacteraceae bacterium]MCI5079033.1 DnaA/Hda family protein [Pelagibacteraceae bacterium]